MTSLCFWIRMVLWYLRYRPIAQSSKERSAHHLCVHAHARPGRPAANPCEATVERSWLEVGREKSRKSAGKWLENSWKLGKLADEFSIISFSEVDRMDLLAISELWLQSKSRENCLHRMIPSGRLLQACNRVTWWLFNAQEDSKWTVNLNVRPGAHEQDCSADLARIQSAARSRPRMCTCRKVHSNRCVIMPTRFQRPEENTKGPKPGSWPLQGYRRTSQSEGHRPPGILVRTIQWKDDGSPPCRVAPLNGRPHWTNASTNILACTIMLI